MVFQDFRLLKDRNVYENVAFAQRVVGTPVKTMRRKVPAMLSMVGLAAKYKSYPREISGGEQQRVAIARALVNEPKILLADEPTGNLDSHNAWEIMKLLEHIHCGPLKAGNPEIPLQDSCETSVCHDAGYFQARLKLP